MKWGHLHCIIHLTITQGFSLIVQSYPEPMRKKYIPAKQSFSGQDKHVRAVAGEAAAAATKTFQWKCCPPNLQPTSHKFIQFDWQTHGSPIFLAFFFLHVIEVAVAGEGE